MSADDVYPEDGACYGHEHPELWDLHVEAETPAARTRRHEEAKRICGTCPVPRACIEARDPMRDEGIRGGQVFKLPSYGYGGYGAVEGIVRKPWRKAAS